jgi:hypothetical protein
VEKESGKKEWKIERKRKRGKEREEKGKYYLS